MDGHTAAGLVHVIYSTNYDLDLTDDTLFDGGDASGSSVETDDAFGTTLACGDFNGDGVADLAVGSPYEDYGITRDVGSVSIFFGEKNVGLTTSGSMTLWATAVGGRSRGDHFGSALAVGDFNSDDIDDLAVGIPHKDIGSAHNTGAVAIFASAQGAGLSDPYLIDQSDIVNVSSATGDEFGLALDAHNGKLAIGIPGKELFHQGAWHADAGQVVVIEPDPVSIPSPQVLQQGGAYAGAPKQGERFGQALAIGSVNGFSPSTVVGIPGDGDAGVSRAGAIQIFHPTNGNQLVHQGSGGIAGDPTPHAYFGSAVDIGDFNADLRNDVVVGIPGKAVGGDRDAGAIHVLRGGSNLFVTGTGDQSRSQDSSGYPSYSERGDRFGAEVLAANLHGSLFHTDIVVGVPGEGLNGTELAAGAAHVLVGSPAGITASGGLFMNQNTQAGVVEGGDMFSGTAGSQGGYQLPFDVGSQVKVAPDATWTPELLFEVPSGTPVHPARDGYVRFIEQNSSAGNYLVIEHPDGEWSIYGSFRNQSVPSYVSVGSFVSYLDPIAESWSTRKIVFAVVVPDQISPTTIGGVLESTFRSPRFCFNGGMTATPFVTYTVPVEGPNDPSCQL